MTRGRRGSLALRRRALPSPPSCRFIPALSHPPPNPTTTQGREERRQCRLRRTSSPKGPTTWSLSPPTPSCRTHHPPASRTTMPYLRCSGSAGTLPHTWLRSSFVSAGNRTQPTDPGPTPATEQTELERNPGLVPRRPYLRESASARGPPPRAGSASVRVRLRRCPPQRVGGPRVRRANAHPPARTGRVVGFAVDGGGKWGTVAQDGASGELLGASEVVPCSWARTSRSSTTRAGWSCRRSSGSSWRRGS